MMKRLCDNCLITDEDVKGVRVGPDKGTQRDPYWDSVSLCPTCGQALLGADFEMLHDRYASERTVRRG